MHINKNDLVNKKTIISLFLLISPSLLQTSVMEHQYLHINLTVHVHAPDEVEPKDNAFLAET